MPFLPFIRQAARDARGATIIEFAVVAPLFFMLILGILEFGLFMMHKIAVESLTMEISREATLGKTSGGPCSGTIDRVGYIRCLAQSKGSAFVRHEQLVVQVNPVSANGTIIPDICLRHAGVYLDPPSSTEAVCDESGDVHEEINGIPGYQSAAASDMGDAGTVMEVRISYPWKVLIPFMAQFFGSMDGSTGEHSGVVMITSSTVVRNEPFN